ncbi:hypothetical protein F5146DRAFT_1064178 [Armillaria mellea]|nr:hypothetical protein F5146DRAFT_1064178 [Armillaria mellea]
MIIGGDTGKEEVRGKFVEPLVSLREMRQWDITLEILSEMQNRVSTRPLDKVAGLAYLLRVDPIPIYDPQQLEADAWEVLVDLMSPGSRVELFFYYPQCGNGKKCWRLSWGQVMTHKISAPRSDCLPGEVSRTEDPDVDWCYGYRIESGDVHGLTEAPKEGKPRLGELVFKDAAESLHTFEIVVYHTHLIPDGSYTLIGTPRWLSSSAHWMVGELKENGKFEKFSVFSLVNDEEVKLSRVLELEDEVQTFLC